MSATLANRNASLAVIEASAPPFITGLDDAVRFGELLAKSGYFKDASDAAKAAVKVLAGAELGIGPISSMTGINIVEGKPELGADLQAKCVKRSKRYNYRITEHTDDVCTIEFYEWGELCGTSRFTMDDARRAQLAGKRNWQQYPKNMLFARALSNGVAFYCPDVTAMRVYSPGEISGAGDVTINGDLAPIRPEEPQGETAPAEQPELVAQDAPPAAPTPSPAPSEPAPSADAEPASKFAPDDLNKAIGDEAAELIVTNIRGRGLKLQRVQLLLAAVGVEDVRDPYAVIPSLTGQQALELAQKIKEEPAPPSA